MVNLLRPASVSSSRLGTVTGLWKEQSPYDRTALNTGIVHFGPGRFFRGHLAYIIHNYLVQKGSQEQKWGICGVSLKSQRTLKRLKPQTFLYTLTKHSSSAKKREEAEVIGSIKEIVNGREKCDYVLEKMTSSSVHLVTLTITQGGYHLDKSFNLDTANEDIAHDLQNPSTPITAIGFIVEALRRRRDRSMNPFTTLSCDNLPRNGEILRKAVLAYAEVIDPQLTEYIRDNATFPNTVVDRIVPQEQESDYNYPRRLLQVRARAPIVTEPFWQFVVEDNFTGERPKWEDVGVIMTKDITPFLYMKSRFLNAVHSFIACLAVRAGIEYMHEAIRQPEIHLFTRLLMDDIAAATPVPREMCEQYMEQVLLRLSNEDLPDPTERIASETARKVGKYIFPILEDAYSRKVNMKRIILPVAAWLLAVREGASESGQSYHAKDTESAITAIQEGAVISGILGLENCEQTEVVDNECHQALQDLQTHGLLTTLKNYSDGGFLNETASA
ncbi:mannitol dehydrogenase family protein [Microcoleus sp. FACHB-672]|uniref:mannitol dehydrogenase family protein n=1 Tax=Microcoleus sp. FACHB-672 TaxID=2692825 RepID=UPI001688CB7E|nr:mannitol dehydrogenase family protein [Microcoleus sp. FACHB-672]MBD2043436.1 mannitol dehydrogenase family protein [Microcoleus sp. FACHB-672]